MKRITLIPALFLAVMVLSGCGANTETPEVRYAINTVLRTVDGGETWEASSENNSGKTVITPEILALEIDPADSQTLYVGTEKDGLFVSSDEGESWKKINFPLARIYGLGISRGDSQVVFASGLLKDRGKIYRTFNGGEDWDEVYSEPANGPVISALAVDPKNQEVVYAANSSGMIIKTTDGGRAWENITKLEGPVSAISFDPGNSATVYFMTFNKSVWRTKNGGASLDNLKENIKTASSSGTPFSLAADPGGSGRFFIGLNNGILEGDDFGDKFGALNVIESSKKFPIRALAVSPRDPKELIYSSAQAIYKSTDGGKTWSTFQLDTARTGSQLKYNPQDPSTIYFGLRKAN
jgi:photosystem II stability/assembly factor-like uncharacterized protein